jgi:transcriptional regulator with XRE-family HTH domain
MPEPLEKVVRIRVEVAQRARMGLGLSLEAIAKRLKVHVGTVQRWLKGKPVSIRNLAVLAQTLNVEVKDLVLPTDLEDTATEGGIEPEDDASEIISEPLVEVFIRIQQRKDETPEEALARVLQKAARTKGLKLGQVTKITVVLGAER